MPKYKTDFTARAAAQLRSIFSYIAEDDLGAAVKMVDRIESRVDLLMDNPRLGAELSENDFPFLTPGYRRLIVKPFILYYRIIDTTVFVTHIVHERQEQRAALQD